MTASSGSQTDAGGKHRKAFSDAGYTPSIIPIPAPEHDPLLTNLEIYALRYQHQPASDKEPLLLIHGHPQNLTIWHRVAPMLASKAQRDIVIVDVRGHGHSGVPRVRNFVRQGHDGAEETPEEDILRQRYSKREVGRDLVYVMTKHYQYNRFAVVGHDRGGRIAHRMAVDHASIITRVMVLDIVPTLDLYDKADSRFASAYWHWYFLIQPYPIPEEMIVNAPKTYLTALVTRFLQDDDETRCKDIFPDEVLSSYLAQLSSMPRVHAMCEDYRASAPGGVDLEQDRSDREKGVKVQQPLRAIWGAKGLNEKLFGTQGCLALWQGVCAEQVSGQALDCGHYLPEEAPDEVTQEILEFF